VKYIFENSKEHEKDILFRHEAKGVMGFKVEKIYNL
jgi:hypothetical protein